MQRNNENVRVFGNSMLDECAKFRYWGPFESANNLAQDCTEVIYDDDNGRCKMKR